MFGSTGHQLVGGHPWEVAMLFVGGLLFGVVIGWAVASYFAAKLLDVVLDVTASTRAMINRR